MSVDSDDKSIIVELCKNNDETGILSQQWFQKNEFKYVMNKDKTSFVLYDIRLWFMNVQQPGNEPDRWFVDSVSQYEIHQRREINIGPVVYIQFCLTDKSVRGCGEFSMLLQQLQELENHVILESKPENFKYWYQRNFAVLDKMGGHFSAPDYVLIFSRKVQQFSMSCS